MIRALAERGGSTPPDGTLANFYSLLGGLTDVALFPAGASPYGVLDMAGNAWEWVADWYDENYYANSALENPHGPGLGIGRVVRGGAWNTVSGAIRVANRFLAFPYRDDFTGFRCALTGE